MVVFFDIGNCIYDPYRTFRRTLQRMEREALADRILDRYGVYPDQPGRQDDWLKAFGFTGGEIETYYQIFFHEPVFHCGIPEVFAQLRRRGAHLGFISDGHFDTQVEKLRAWGLADRFDPDLRFIGSTSADRGRAPGVYAEGIQLPGSKHEVETFRFIGELVRRFYGIGAPGCTMVGDHYVRDALHPTLAGWRGVWFVPNEPARRTRDDESTPAEADIPEIDDLRRLVSIVYPDEA